MGSAYSKEELDDLETAEDQDYGEPPIFMTRELFLELSGRKEEKVSVPDDDYPIDTFAGKGFFSTEKNSEAKDKAEEILKKYPIPNLDDIVDPCYNLESVARTCMQARESKIDCSEQVDAFLKCSKESLLNRLSSS